MALDECDEMVYCPMKQEGKKNGQAITQEYVYDFWKWQEVAKG